MLTYSSSLLFLIVCTQPPSGKVLNEGFVSICLIIELLMTRRFRSNKSVEWTCSLVWFFSVQNDFRQLSMCLPPYQKRWKRERKPDFEYRHLSRMQQSEKPSNKLKQKTKNISVLAYMYVSSVCYSLVVLYLNYLLEQAPAYFQCLMLWKISSISLLQTSASANARCRWRLAGSQTSGSDTPCLESNYPSLLAI